MIFNVTWVRGSDTVAAVKKNWNNFRTNRNIRQEWSVIKSNARMGTNDLESLQRFC